MTHAPLTFVAFTLLVSSCSSETSHVVDAGCESTAIIATGSDAPTWFALDAAHAYWSATDTTTNTATIKMADRCDGTTRDLFSGRMAPSKMLVRGDVLYVSDSLTTGAISAINIDDGAATALAAQHASVVDFTVDEQSLYWLDAGALRTVPLAGGTSADLAVGLDDPAGLAIDQATLFWVDRGSESAPGDVESMPAAGGLPTKLANGQPFVGGHVGALALDSANIYLGGWAGEILAIPRVGGPATKLALSQNASVVAVSGAFVYWINVTQQPDSPIRGLWRIAAGGGAAEHLDNDAVGSSLVVQDDFVYYLVPQGIARLRP